MKQRRRWMNGALFGTWKVILNGIKMISWSRNDHPWYRQLLMFFFMIYLVLLYLLQFMTVGAIFISIMIFFNHVFKIMFSDDTYGETMEDV